MSEELRNALEAAIDTHSDPEPANETQSEPATAVSPEPEPAEPAVQANVEAGAEAAPKDEKPPVEADAPEQTAAEQTAQQQEQARQHRVDRPPQSWKKEAKGEWNALPLHVRQEVYRREMQVEKALQESAPARQLAQEFQQTVQPYMARIQSMGATPVQAVQNLLQADYLLATATPAQAAQFMAKLIKDYEVDITALDQALANVVSNVPQQPDISSLVQRQVQQALAPLIQERQQKEQQQQAQVSQTIEQMALDPAYPYFDEVRDEMADLIEVYSRRGVYITLQEAYNKAVAANPNTSQEIQRQGMVGQATQQHQQAQRAKVAASSVSGAPAGGGAGSFQSDGSLRGAIEAAFGGQRL